LVATVLVERREISNEMAQFTGIGTMFRKVLTAEVEHLVEGDRPKVESDLFKVSCNDMASSRQRRHLKGVDQRLKISGVSTGGLQGITRGFGRTAQQLREYDKDESSYDRMQGNGEAVFTVTRKTAVTELFEDNLGQSCIGGAAEPGLRKLGTSIR
jgi:hypothetical protein